MTTTVKGPTMVTMSRRKVLGLAVGLWGAVTLLPGCCWLRQIIGYPCEVEVPEWKRKSKDFWTNRVKERTTQRIRDRSTGKRPDVKTPYPWLKVDFGSSHGQLIDQCGSLPILVSKDVYFTILNAGNAASMTTCVELYQGPIGYGWKYSSARLVSRKITTLLAGQRKEVCLQWQRTALKCGLVARCYDPVLDPGAATYTQYFRQSNGFVWA